MKGAGENFIVNKDNMEELKEQLQKAIREVPHFEKLKNHIDMTVTNEGLRIELTESANGTFFDAGSARISGDGEDLLRTLAGELGKLPNHIAMEGHTDSKPYAAGRFYGNWELSSDRANAARRLMQEAGIREDQVTQVRGFADQRLRNPKDPMDPGNRRISLIVQYMEKQAAPATAGTEGEKAGSEAGKEGSEPAEGTASKAPARESEHR
jgi:chemotaxis protein MotB